VSCGAAQHAADGQERAADAKNGAKLGLEGIVSKRKDSVYRSGRSPDWLKMKNADAPAVKREEEEDWETNRPMQ
jgi:ATP-dependent DNA ligase